MKISLVDFDRTGFPNLALMKISAWHKSNGDAVDFYEPLFSKPDIIYASKAFKFNPHVFFNEKCEIITGGTGFNLDGILQDEIEHACPDYSLYPNTDYSDCSIGFITRGCIRNCDFCVVPKKEGNIRFNAHISEFQKHKKVLLLDGNILACDKGIDELKAISKTKTRIDVNQGLDFRLLDNSIAELLASLKWIRFIRTACDSDGLFNTIKNAVELLGKKGVKPYRIFCYCLVKSEKDIPRILELDKLGIEVFAMGYMDFETGEKTQEVIDICHWVNKKSIFKSEKDYEKVRLRK